MHEKRFNELRKSETMSITKTKPTKGGTGVQKQITT